MRVGVDIDGVVANFVAAFLPLVPERYGITIRERDIYVHDLYLVLGVRPHEALDLIRDTIRQDLQPYPGAVRGLKRLRKSHEVTLVTARPTDMMDVTRDWLENRGIAYDGLLHFEEGLKHTNNYSFDAFVDDHLREALGFVERVPHIIVFDHPWNRTFNVGRLIHRVSNWRRLVELIEALAE